MQKLNANMVIIGGGGAGLAAALTAIDKGLKDIIIVEKRFTVGGNSSMAGGMIFAAESKHQKEAGAVVDRDEVFKETMAFHHYDRVNPHILRAFINKSASTIDWLESLGLPFEWRGRVHVLKGTTTPFGGFSRATKVMAEKITSAGGKILTNTAAKRILRSSDGKIIGVTAVTKEEQEIQINTNTVVITTGGFTGNENLLRKYFPHQWDNVYWTDAIPLDGDGITLAGTAGAALEDYSTLIKENGYCFGKSGKLPNRIHMEEGAVWVNKYGRRYIDETVFGNEGANALVAQPGKIAFALFDDRLIQKVNDRPNPMVSLHETPGKSPSLRDILQSEAKEGVWCKIADDWTEIARWIGADPAVLKATVNEYNAFCERGRDELFARDPRTLYPLAVPPFYAVKFRPLMIDTVGPVRINEYMQVLDREDNPIPGLYAAGVITSGWQGHDYHLFGSALGYSLTSGRIAGENAAKFCLKAARG